MTRRRPSLGRVTLAAVVALGASGCGGGTPDDTPFDTGTGTQSNNGGATDSETQSETVEQEIPPELPSLCSIVLEQTSASETSGGDASTWGDARWPSFAMRNDVGFLVLAYRDGVVPHDWDIRVLSYDAQLHGTGEPAPLVAAEPVAKGTSSRYPAAAVAQDGTTFIVFEDTRWDTSCSQNDLSACRAELGLIALDPTGVPVASDAPIRLTSGSAVSTWPSLAATDAGLIVAWREAAYDGKGSANVLFVDSDGNPGAVQSLTPKQDVDDESRVAIASRGDGALAVFGLFGPERIGAMRLLPDGTSTGEMLVVDEGGLCREPAVVATSEGYLVVWRRQIIDDYEVFARTVSSQGELGQVERLSYTTQDVGKPAVAWNGSLALVTWPSALASGATRCSESSCAAQIEAALIDAGGALVAAELTLSSDINEQSNPTVAWDGSGFVVAWEARRNLRQEVFYGRVVCEP